MFTPTRYFVLSEMAYTTSAKAKSPVHQQKFKSIKHEQVLVDNAVEDFVDRAWFGRASSNVFPQRDEMRRKLLTGRSKTVAGRGGLEVSESDLVALWPLFLNVDTQAARPSLSLLDVELMIEQCETWKYNDTDPRILKDAEVAAIETWYESARARDPPARRLSENGRHAMKAKIGDVAPRFGRYSTKTGSIEARNTRRTDRRGRAACHAIHAGLGLQYPDPDEDLAAFTQASDSEEKGHVESPVKRRRCEPVGHAEVSRAASCGGGGELANARIPDGSSADGKQAPPSHSSCTTAEAPPAAAPAAADTAPSLSRCAAFSQKGSRCKLHAVPGSDRYHRHRRPETAPATGGEKLEYKSSNVDQGQLLGPKDLELAPDAVYHAARRFIVAALDAVYVDKRLGDKARTVGGERAKVRARESSQHWLLPYSEYTALYYAFSTVEQV